MKFLHLIRCCSCGVNKSMHLTSVLRCGGGFVIGRIRLSVSTVNRTYELSGITHVTPFRKYGKHSTGSSTYGPWARTYSKLFSCKPVHTVCSYGAQSNEICTYGRVSRGTIPRVRRYGLLYLRTVEYDHCAARLSDIASWCRHQMETFSVAICAGNSPVAGESPSQRPMTRSFDVFFHLRLNKRLSIQSWGWWFETPLPIMTSL